MSEMIVPAIVQAFCLQPTEITGLRMDIDPTTHELGEPREWRGPGVCLDYSLAVHTAQGWGIVPVAIGMDRAMAERLHEALTKFLEDGGHYHAYNDHDTVERQPMQTEVLTDVPDLQVPDSLPEELG